MKATGDPLSGEVRLYIITVLQHLMTAAPSSCSSHMPATARAARPLSEVSPQACGKADTAIQIHFIDEKAEAHKR